jgi:hypothetical protein
MSKFIHAVILLLIFTPLFGLDLPVFQIADDSQLRTQLEKDWFMETPEKVLARRGTLFTLENGEKVQVSVEAGREEFAIFLARERMTGKIAVNDSKAVPRFGMGEYPGFAQGSWILIRKIKGGEASLLRYFPRTDRNMFIQFRPLNNEKCQMDVVLYGAYTVRSLPIGIPFKRLYSMPLNDILNLTGNKFPLKYFEPDPDKYREQNKLVANIRSRLGELKYVDDGAIDENGNYVFINNLQPQKSAGLNCSGFAKWVIDGIVRPVTGKRLSINLLKEPFGNRGSSFTEPWETIRDPYFGLDWIRNLASQANGILRSDAYRELDEFEVRNNIFSGIIVAENRTQSVHSYPGFLHDAGYGIEGLQPLLYVLAIDQPYQFYLAAINNEIDEGQDRTLRLRQFYHVAVLVPYFDEFGSFHIIVFESAGEKPYYVFKADHKGAYVNLVQIPAVETFDP